MVKNSKIIVGITGTNGSGKGTVVKRLVEKYNFGHQSARELIGGELKKRGLPITRENLIGVSYELRTKHGPDVFARRMYESARNEVGNQVIESIRNPSEIDYLEKQNDFLLLAVDADLKKRYERIRERGSSTDNETFKSFMEKEAREMQSDDPNSQNLKACIKRADHIILNNGSIEELYKKVDEVIQNELSSEQKV